MYTYVGLACRFTSAASGSEFKVSRSATATLVICITTNILMAVTPACVLYSETTHQLCNLIHFTLLLSYVMSDLDLL